MGSNRISSVSDPTEAQDAATKNYVDTHSGSGTAILALDNTFTGTNTFEANIIGEAGLQLKKIENAGTGALSFHWQSNTQANQEAYILIQGSGTNATSGADPGQLIIARDTAPGNVIDADKFVTYYAGRGNNAVKTIFNNTVEVPTPVNANDAVTKAYADQHLVSTTETYASGTFTMTLTAINHSGAITPTNPGTLKTATGYYIRIGNMVNFTIDWGTFSTVGYFGQAEFTGLPFKGASNMGVQITEVYSFNALNNQDGNAAERDDFHFAIQSNTTKAYVYNTQSDQNTVANINSASSCHLIISGSYITEDQAI